MRRIAIIGLLITAFSYVYAAIINETIKSNCPSDPTFSGQCSLKEVKTDNYSCKAINGVQVCRDWWKKEYFYECSGGNVDNSAIFNSFKNQSYCKVVSNCKKWEDVSLKDGKVSCRVYIDLNRPGCETNPNKPDCIADDCGDIAKKCTFKEYISYGNLPDKANTTYDTYCDPVSGGCGLKEVPGASGLNLGTYVYECPSSVRKICRDYDTVLKCPAECPNGAKVDCPDNSNQATCPDGSIATCKTETCNTVKTCKKYQTVSIPSTDLKSCEAPRNYTEIEVYKNSTEYNQYLKRTDCIAVGEKQETKNVIGRFVWGWDGDCDDDCGTCESYISGLKMIIDGREYPVWGACLMISSSPGVFPSSSNLATFFTQYIQSVLKWDGTVISASNARDTASFSGASTCFGADCAPSRFREVDLTVAFTKVKFQCFLNSINTANCSDYTSSCTQVDKNPNDLSTLSCGKIATDIYNPMKKMCSSYLIQYQCPSNTTKQECLEYETKTVCNGVSYPMKSVEVENKDFTSNFSKAVALSQLANELKHIWSGKYLRCDSGWWSGVLEDPLKYLENKLVSYIISRVGSQFMSAARIFATQYVGQCATPNPDGTYSYSIDPSAVATVTNSITSCMTSAFQTAWAQGGTEMQSMLANLGFNPSAANLAGNPVVQFAIQVALDIVLTTEQCNACNNKKCAEKHGQYDTYGLLQGDNCVFVEDGCAWKVDLGFTKVCLRKKYMYCCYDSTFARILVQQAYKQLGYSFSGGNCSALTFDDIKKLDFSKMDWSELQAYLERKMNSQIDPNLIKTKLDNYYNNTKWTGEVPYK